ncbi:MAG TPA: TetR/AcrR family transcriptional regulator [Acidimicrobiales bacterium]|nr:TetR/AcrR family transcriptional regulator [Acidimicrobiales bacterium]
MRNDYVALWHDGAVTAPDTLSLPSLLAGIPPAPGPELDPYLDAAASCFAKHGVRRTSVQDVARVMGVNRTTVYRQIGNVEDMVRLLVAREFHRFREQTPFDLQAHDAPGAILQLLVAIVHRAQRHPVLIKVLRDEPEMIGPFLASDMPSLIRRVADEVVPLLDWAVANGAIAAVNAEHLAEWLVRAAISVILAPPAGDVETFLSEMLLPVLRPTPPAPQPGKRRRRL